MKTNEPGPILAGYDGSDRGRDGLDAVTPRI